MPPELCSSSDLVHSGSSRVTTAGLFEDADDVCLEPNTGSRDDLRPRWAENGCLGRIIL